MSDAGGSADIMNVTLTFGDAAAGSLPDNTQIVSGLFKPTNFGAGDTFPAPAPAGPYGSALSVFNETAPNGTWRLYVVDDASGDIGNINGGWTLRITTSTCQQIMTPNLFESVNQTTQIDSLLDSALLKYGNGAIN